MAGLRSVCVFCGSNPGRRPEYPAGAAALGRPGAPVKWMDADGADIHPGAQHHPS